MSRLTMHTGVMVGLVAALVGCQSQHDRGRDVSDTEARAVMCAKCETVWTDRIDLNDPYARTVRPERVTVCPDCESAVASFFKTGKLEHTCRACGGEIRHCTVHRR